jgi:CRISPR system Cascade subunit CasB
MTESAAATAAKPGLAAEIARLASIIDRPDYSPGERASLRRWAPGQPIPLAFYRLWLKYLRAELPEERQAEAWMALAWGLATCQRGCHTPGRPFGQALAESDFPEGRLERLLSAPEDVRIELFMNAVRFLASRGECFNWVEASQFLLATDPQKRESIHRRIAAAYFRHQPQESKGKE